MLLRQRLSQLLTCIEDMSSDDEASDEVSRTLDEAFQLCGRFIPTDAFRLTRAHAHSHTHKFTQIHRREVFEFSKIYLDHVWVSLPFDTS